MWEVETKEPTEKDEKFIPPPKKKEKGNPVNDWHRQQDAIQKKIVNSG